MKALLYPPPVVCPECGNFMVRPVLDEEYADHVTCINASCDLWNRVFQVPAFTVDLVETTHKVVSEILIKNYGDPT